MAGLESFLSSLMGGASGANVEDMMNFQNQVRENNILNDLAPAVLGAKFKTDTWSPTETLGVTAGQAFLGTLLSGLARRDAAQQFSDLSSVLPQLYEDPLSVAIPEGVDPEAFGSLKLSALTRRKTGEQEFKHSVIKNLFEKRPDLAAQFLLPKKESQTIEDTQALKTLPGLASGNDSSAKKITSYYQGFLAEGMPPVQAASAAKQQVEGEIKANIKTLDEAKAAREYGQRMLDLTSTARAGMGQAGETGSKVASMYEKALSVLAPWATPEADRQSTGDQVLASIAPELVKMSRSPGPVTDYETKLYLGSGPSINNTPETNAILAQKMEDLGKLNLDYADFIDAYRQANSGSTVGAAKKWSEYRQAFPLFNQTGADIQLNTNRPSWQDYFSGSFTSEQYQPLTPDVPEVIPEGMKLQRNKKTGETRLVPK